MNIRVAGCSTQEAIICFGDLTNMEHNQIKPVLFGWGATAEEHLVKRTWPLLWGSCEKLDPIQPRRRGKRSVLPRLFQRTAQEINGDGDGC